MGRALRILTTHYEHGVFSGGDRATGWTSSTCEGNQAPQNVVSEQVVVAVGSWLLSLQSCVTMWASEHTLPIDPSTAFVSYSREDLEFILRLTKDLKARGAKVWMVVGSK